MGEELLAIVGVILSLFPALRLGGRLKMLDG